MKTAASFKRKTAESKRIEKLLLARFQCVEAYRYNSVSIRIRVIDPCFKGKSPSERESLVYPLIDELPEKTQQDITMLLLQTPEEHKKRQSFAGFEFDDPSPSSL